VRRDLVLVVAHRSARVPLLPQQFSGSAARAGWLGSARPLPGKTTLIEFEFGLECWVASADAVAKHQQQHQQRSPTESAGAGSADTASAAGEAAPSAKRKAAHEEHNDVGAGSGSGARSSKAPRLTLEDSAADRATASAASNFATSLASLFEQRVFVTVMGPHVPLYSLLSVGTALRVNGPFASQL
jgi:hypothetical protein